METFRFLLTSTFYPPYHLGGDAIHVKYLADELVRRGHEVLVLHSVDAFNVKRKNNGQVNLESDKVTTHPLRSPFGRLSPLSAYVFGSSFYVEKNFERVLNEFPPDVVHHHNISLLGHTLLRKRGRYKQLYTAHDHWLICPKNDYMRKGRMCEEKRCASCLMRNMRPPQLWRKKLNLSDIDLTICPSAYMAGQLKELGLRMVVIPNFAPFQQVDLPEGKEDYFLYLGVIEEHKGIKILLNAFAESKNELVIGGKGSLSGWLEKVIERDHLSNRVRYLHEVGGEKWTYLAKASAVVIPSICLENSPLVALEALSVGTPIICTNMGGTREIAEKISGNLVIPVDELHDRLRTLSPPTIDRNLIMKIFNEEYTIDKYMERYMAIVKEGV
ncbi:MAG: hypothetical protein AYK23_00315 [Candidatus Proteinoplasmatales archaeon SG8-5]|nr:MAG: hypothetical protein AYK23_00315 [Candidatus Proteinoplasmatales archaeon SG8-5]